ncbi:MAG TPA: four helix bundle protein [Bryobacteraceae bacterium]|nr:four helix bundle protein [Bryobacteraceae bacterium]
MPANLAVKSYRDLQVWRKAMALVVESYSVARLLPKSENYGLIGQIQRAAVSVPANIAEGHGREHLGDYLRHLSFANGSLMELETHFLIAVELGYVTREQSATLMSMASEVGRMLNGLTRKLRGPLTPGT